MMPRALVAIQEEELAAMHRWFNASRVNTSHQLQRMEYFEADIMLGANFSFQEFVKIVNQARSDNVWFGPATQVPLIIAYVSIILFGLFANGLICYVVVWRKKLRTVRNLFIMNLAVSDILLCAFCMPFTLAKLLLKNWVLGDAMCRLIPWMQAVNVFASTITITAIALDRYQNIVCPDHRNESERRLGALTVIVAIWLSSVLVGLPLLVYSQVEEKEYIQFVKHTMCLERWPSPLSRVMYAAVILLLQFVIPIIIIVVIHWKICNFLKGRIAKNPANAMEMSRAIREASRHNRNSTLLMAIAVMFALCWFPLTLLNFLADFNYNLFMFQNFLLGFAVAHLIAMISACLNPIMYGWFNSNFRREFTKIVCFWKFNVPTPDLVLPKESCHLVDERVVYNRRLTYKAIQTEVQPRLNLSSYDIHLKGSSSSTPGVHQWN